MFDIVVRDLSSVCLYGMDGGDYIHDFIQVSFDLDYGDVCSSYDSITDKCDGCGRCDFSTATIMSSFTDI